MGQDTSQLLEAYGDGPPHRLRERSLAALAEYMTSRPDLRVVVMTGAGISTAAGIPDFRSDTGIYSKLAGTSLPSPEAIFDISYFRSNPEPFFALAKELYPGQFYPTMSHAFLALLHKKGLLHMLFTQNIDCLERRAGVPEDRIVEAHGSFATNRCIECRTDFPADAMHEAVMAGKVPHCTVPQCNGLVKPDIVFFGEQLPERFFRNIGAISEADLVIVMGTSLSVQPVASLPQRASNGTPRLLINREKVGDLGLRPDDVSVLGDCDEGVLKLAEELGWKDALLEVYAEVGGAEEKARTAEEEAERRKGMSKDALLEDEVNRLAIDVEETLQVSRMHTEAMMKELASSQDTAQTNPVRAVPPSKIELPPPTPGVAPEEVTCPTGFKEPLPTPAVGEFPITKTPPEKVSSSLSLIAEGQNEQESDERQNDTA